MKIQDNQEEKVEENMPSRNPDLEPYFANVAGYAATIEAYMQQLKDEQVVERIWKHDHTVWKPEPDEISNRLGWLHSVDTMRPALDEIKAFAEEVRTAGFHGVLLLGMGGSSLAPEVYRKVFGVAGGYPEFAILDSTDPAAVLEAEKNFPPQSTLYIVSTKSGGTVETLSFFKYFYTRAVEELGAEQAGHHFAAITDPGSGLEKMAREYGFRKIFRNDPDIGGRYSALSYFGLVPAALVGIDVSKLLDRAGEMAEACRRVDENPGVWLGAILGQLALQGRDKLTLVTSPSVQPIGAWIEQLVAESTGKEGKGILPVDGEAPAAPEAYGPDRVFAAMRLADESLDEDWLASLGDAGHPDLEIILEDVYDLGAEFFRWEFATIIASHALQINPFDQPNVESAKVQARKVVAAFQEQGELPRPQPAFETDACAVYSDAPVSSLADALDALLKHARTGRSYLAIQAYVPPQEATSAQLQTLQAKLRDHTRLATTLGFGPRFLHSTGQLHKGDAGHGLFLMLTAESETDAAIPDEPGSSNSAMSFQTLKMAQALGDRQALLEAGRPVLWLHCRKGQDGVALLADLLADSAQLPEK